MLAGLSQEVCLEEEKLEAIFLILHSPYTHQGFFCEEQIMEKSFGW